MELTPYVCTCCGGQIDISSMKCKYCDTPYHHPSSTKEKIEKEILEKWKELITAKTEALQSAKRIEELYANAISAMKKYGRGI